MLVRRWLGFCKRLFRGLERSRGIAPNVVGFSATDASLPSYLTSCHHHIAVCEYMVYHREARKSSLCLPLAWVRHRRLVNRVW